MKKSILLFFILSIINGYSQKNYWKETQETINYENVVDQPAHFKSFSLETSKLTTKLLNAPSAFDSSNSNVIIELPNEQGELLEFRIFEKSNFANELAKKYPTIKAYIGKSVKGKSIANISYSPSQGFNIAITNSKKPTTLIKPLIRGENTYLVYSRK